MRRLLLPAIAVIIAASFAALIAFGVSRTGDDRSIDQAVAADGRPLAPGADEQLPLLNGKGTVSLQSLRGKTVVLNIWASWCPPCRDEAPDLAALQKRIAPLNATVLGVTWNDTVPDARRFIERTKLEYLQARDVGGSFAKAYGTKGLPETFIIDPTGHVTALRRGAVDRAFLDAALVPLLGRKAAAK